MGLSRGLIRCGVTDEWTTQDLMNAMETDHQRRQLLTLPPSSQRTPRGLFLHQLARAITGQEPPARARQRHRDQHRAARAEERRAQAQDKLTKKPMPAWFREAVARHAGTAPNAPTIPSDNSGIIRTSGPTVPIRPAGTNSTMSTSSY